MSHTYIQTHLRWRSTTFLMYLHNTIYAAAAHTKAIHIPTSHTPWFTTKYEIIHLPGGATGITNATTAFSALPIFCPQEDFEQIRSARTAYV